MSRLYVAQDRFGGYDDVRYQRQSAMGHQLHPQALVETGLASDKSNKESLIGAVQWLGRCQIRENPKYFEVSNRHRTKGAWPFSTKEQGYTVSDCTGEGLKSVLYLQNQLE